MQCKKEKRSQRRRKKGTKFQRIDFKKEERFVILSTCTSTTANGRYIVAARIT